jgi:hypothetical protein
MSRVCRLFSDLFYPNCIVIDTPDNPYPAIPWQNVRHLKITADFLENKSREFLMDFFNNVGPNLRKLYLDFGPQPPTHSSEIFLLVLNKNPNLEEIFAHVHAWGFQGHNIMSNVVILNLQIYSISPFEGLQFEYEEDRYFPNLEEFNIEFDI